MPEQPRFLDPDPVLAPVLDPDLGLVLAPVLDPDLVLDRFLDLKYFGLFTNLGRI